MLLELKKNINGLQLCYKKIETLIIFQFQLINNIQYNM